LKEWWTSLTRSWIASIRRLGLSGVGTRPSIPDAPVLTAEDILSRFLEHKRHFSKTNNRVKPDRFLPRDDHGTLQTSTFHTTGLTEDAIWDLGVSHRGSVRGRGDVAVQDVRDVRLHVVPDYDPFRHVGLTGWPVEFQEQMTIAQELAARATLHIRPDPGRAGPAPSPWA
jgi:hypothetical protein